MSRHSIWEPVLYVCAFLLLVAGLLFSGLQLMESTVYSSNGGWGIVFVSIAEFNVLITVLGIVGSDK